MLVDGRRVKVLIATPEPLDWHGGLEAGLIRMMRPVWNITGAA